MTDMTEHQDADTVIDAAMRDAVTAGDTGMMVTVEDAAVMAGVSVRTIRRWIQAGSSPARRGRTRQARLAGGPPLAKERAGRGHDRGQRTRPSGDDRGHDTMATNTDAAMTASALSSATAQMEAIRDQWLRPLVDHIEELSRENGRLEAERDSLRVEIDRMRVTPEDAPTSEKQAPMGDVSAPEKHRAHAVVGVGAAVGFPF